jgi:hypothetical protein
MTTTKTLGDFQPGDRVLIYLSPNGWVSEEPTDKKIPATVIGKGDVMCCLAWKEGEKTSHGAQNFNIVGGFVKIANESLRFACEPLPKPTTLLDTKLGDVIETEIDGATYEAVVVGKASMVDRNGTLLGFRAKAPPICEHTIGIEERICGWKETIPLPNGIVGLLGFDLHNHPYTNTAQPCRILLSQGTPPKETPAHNPRTLGETKLNDEVEFVIDGETYIATVIGKQSNGEALLGFRTPAKIAFNILSTAEEHLQRWDQHIDVLLLQTHTRWAQTAGTSAKRLTTNLPCKLIHSNVIGHLGAEQLAFKTPDLRKMAKEAIKARGHEPTEEELTKVLDDVQAAMKEIEIDTSEPEAKSVAPKEVSLMPVAIGVGAIIAGIVHAFDKASRPAARVVVERETKEVIDSEQKEQVV